MNCIFNVREIRIQLYVKKLPTYSLYYVEIASRNCGVTCRLEDANSKLSRELHEREEDLMILHEDMQHLTDQMNAMNHEYTSEIGAYVRVLQQNRCMRASTPAK